ncbi:tryptophan synthase subunit alpha [Amycolatopsis sp. cg5]|uniref:tryptophan synthase subunit alpha n=1 Tax=Amycolatopsis sp. cg5 TaxID=3238802 RepID=UPI0035267620
MNALETRTRATREQGRKLLAPYVTGGITDDWTDYLRAYQDAGADLIEIGLPFSDPTLDGPTVQQASDRALSRGTTVDGILEDLTKLDLSIPLVTMTYANLVLRNGAGTFCAALRDAGVTGLIVPDLPVDEMAPVSEAAVRHGIDLVLLAAPSTGPDRLRTIAERSRGFVYAVSLMGTTGEKHDLPSEGRTLARSLGGLTDLPVLVGFGVSRPEHAAEAARYADGVIIGSALMRKVLDGSSADDLYAELAGMRTALDAVDD